MILCLISFERKKNKTNHDQIKNIDNRCLTDGFEVGAGLTRRIDESSDPGLTGFFVNDDFYKNWMISSSYLQGGKSDGN